MTSSRRSDLGRFSRLMKRIFAAISSMAVRQAARAACGEDLGGAAGSTSMAAAAAALFSVRV